MVATTADVRRTASFLHIPFGGHGEREGSCRDRVKSMAIGEVPVRCAILISSRRQALAKVCAYIASRAEPSLYPAHKLNALGISMILSLQQIEPPMVPIHSLSSC